MKVKELIEHLNYMVRQNPALLNAKVVCASDDTINEVYRWPIAGDYNYHSHEFEDMPIDDENANSVCIN